MAVMPSTPSQEPAKRKHKPSVKADSNNPDGDNNPVEPQADNEEGRRLIMKWDDNEAKLSWSMIGAIGNDPVIKRGLFPPEGPNQHQNGGKMKTEHYWAVCVALFANHDDYKVAFNQAVHGIPKDKTVWCNKIKNRISKMTEITWKGNTILGETGAGITKAEQINMTDDNTFTDKWRNSQSDFDLGVLIPGTGGEDLTISDAMSGIDNQSFSESSEGHNDGEQSDLGQTDSDIEVPEVNKRTGLAIKPLSTPVMLSDASSETKIEFGAAVTKKLKKEGARASINPC
ncbi:hypothetical protein JAAARDRAFT_192865 [Jaapia argillacea MUCL 33604]|uniref:Uncharacterized protein n=1 Tax=Jaapia argillacea MUCL 33604 TaxID=933084 RepID=A0A067PXA0_9AGAM|nr:hypothetical protein JAAARDRAFT_192865 [Jaapia argillacea MUCL 33604]